VIVACGESEHGQNTANKPRFPSDYDTPGPRFPFFEPDDFALLTRLISRLDIDL